MLARFVVLCAALAAAPAAAQPTEPVTIPAPAPLAPPPPAPSAADVLVGIADGTPTRRPSVSTDVLVGLPIAVRAQAKVVGPVWAEAGVGVWIIIPDLFAGVRLDVGLYRGREDTVAVRPGLTAHAILNPFYGGGGWLGGGPPVVPGVAADVDLVWEHCWTDRFRGLLGLKLGAITAIRSDPGVIPTGGLLFGCQF